MMGALGELPLKNKKSFIRTGATSLPPSLTETILEASLISAGHILAKDLLFQPRVQGNCSGAAGKEYPREDEES